MVEDDGGVGEGVGEVDQVSDLRVVAPALEAEAARRQMREALAEGLVAKQPRDRVAVPNRVLICWVFKGTWIGNILRA